jgi:hypothetical protein
LVHHSKAASCEESSEKTGLEPSSFGDASVRSREEALLGKTRFATIRAQAFVAYTEAEGVVALFWPWDSGKTSTPSFVLEVLEGVEDVSVRNEAMLPRGSASFAATEGRLLGSDNRPKGSALV